MFDSGATHLFVSCSFSNRLGRDVGRLSHPMVLRVADNRTLYTEVYSGCTPEISGLEFSIDLIPVAMREVCVTVDVDWMDTFEAEISCHRKQVRVQIQVGENWPLWGDTPRLSVASCSATVVVSDVAIVPELVTYSLRN
ncbi:hypothetical protein L1887_32150 [Cichorium endivia]|nr:hypothetical protein L1887_32150 [Cichorium endivia]